MSTGMWWKDDIRNVLQGIALASPYMGAELAPDEADAFREGFVAALASVALSLGIADSRASAGRLRSIHQSTHFLEAR